MIIIISKWLNYILRLGNVCREERILESHFTAGCFSAAHRCRVFRLLSDVGRFSAGSVKMALLLLSAETHRIKSDSG